MGGLGAAFSALGGGFGDVFSRRLGVWAVLCVLLALAATVAAAWSAFHFLLPLIPHASGAIGWAWDGARLLAGAGVLVLAVLLASPISMLIGGLLFDLAAGRIEKTVFPADPPGRNLPPHEGALIGLRIALPALALNLISLPLLFVPVVNLVWFLGLNGFLMGREYFTLAAVRRLPWRDARALRRRHGLAVFVVGVGCSLIPFIAPLVGAAAMTRLFRALSTTNSATAR